MALIRESVGMAIGSFSTSAIGTPIGNARTALTKTVVDGTGESLRTEAGNYTAPFTAIVAYLDATIDAGGTGFRTILNSPANLPGSGLGNTYNSANCRAALDALATTMRARCVTRLGATAGNAFKLKYNMGNEVATAGGWTANAANGGATGFVARCRRLFRDVGFGLASGDPNCYIGYSSIANAFSTRQSNPGHNIFGRPEGSGTRLWSPLDFYLDGCRHGAWDTGDTGSAQPTVGETIVAVLASFPNVTFFGESHPYPNAGHGLITRTGNLRPFYTTSPPAGGTAVGLNSLADATTIPAPGTLADRGDANGEPWRHLKWLSQIMYDSIIAAGGSVAQAKAHSLIDTTECAPGFPPTQWAATAPNASGTNTPVHYLQHWAVVHSNAYYWANRTHTASVAGVDGPPGVGTAWTAGREGDTANSYGGTENHALPNPAVPLSTFTIWWHAMWRQHFARDPDVDDVIWGGPNAIALGGQPARAYSGDILPFQIWSTPGVNVPFKWGIPYGPLSAPGEAPMALPEMAWYTDIKGMADDTDIRLASPATAPGQVGTVTAIAGPAKVDLDWAAPVDGGSPITGYRVVLDPPASGPYVVTPSAATITGLADGVTYSATVQALNAVGTGAASNVVTFRPTGPTIGPFDDWTADGSVVPKVDWETLTENATLHGNSVPTFSSDGSKLHIVQDRDTRSVFWPLGQTLLLNREVRSKLVDVDSHGARQPGHVHRLLDPGGPNEVAITVTRNIAFAVDYNFNVHLMGKGITDNVAFAGGGGYRQIGSVNFCVAADAGCSSPNVPPYASTIWAQYPLNMKTRLVGNVLDLAVWKDSETEPAYGDAAPARTATFTLADAQLPATPGYDGWYVGHIATASQWVEFDNLVAQQASLPTRAPTVPRTVTAIKGNTTVSLSWAAPSDPGTSPVTNYRVTTIPADVVPQNVGNVLVTTITGLTNGRSYRFTVAAENATGFSAESAFSNAVVPTAPSPPPPPPPNPPPTPTPVPLPPSTEALLDGKIQNRADRFIFELLDRDMVSKGTLDVDASRPVTVTFDTARNAAFRTMEGFSLPRGDLANINALTDRVRANLVLQNDAQFPLGVFRFGSNVKAPSTYGVAYSPSMFDDGWVLDQKTSATITAQKGTTAHTLISRVLGRLGIDFADVLIDAPDATYADTAAWRAGTSHYAILRDAALFLGCYPPYFTNAGLLKFRTVASENPTMQHRYAKGYRIVDGTVLETDDSFQTPNEWVAIGSNTNGEVVGSYLVPKAAPYSFAQRGIRITETVDLAGSPDSAHAKASARAAALRDSRRIYISVTFGALLDPRHDGFDVFSYDGLPFLEQSWRIECQSGAPMTHTGTRLWADAEDQ